MAREAAVWESTGQGGGQRENPVLQKYLGIPRVWELRKRTRFESRKYALKWTVASVYSPVTARTPGLLIFQLKGPSNGPARNPSSRQGCSVASEVRRWWGDGGEHQEFILMEPSSACDVAGSRGEAGGETRAGPPGRPRVESGRPWP